MEMKASFRISAGDFSLQAKMDIADRRNGILGASGCGKSMTLKALAGILTPDEGRIELGDRVLFDSRAGINVPARERGIGYLFQNYALFPNMNTEQNIGAGLRGGKREIREKVDEIVKTVKENKAPMTIDELDNKLNYEHPDYIKAVASISRLLSTLNGLWGLSKWPSVNPKNIRDKIFVILESRKEPMHFSDIAKEIADSNFKRKNVTVQAIHNELIKDSRFILIGRGIYALSSWGYKKGTISDIIKSVLEKSAEPLTREEIVKQVLKVRKVKETTVLLNLQNKKLFKKIDKNSYTLV